VPDILIHMYRRAMNNASSHRSFPSEATSSTNHHYNVCPRARPVLARLSSSIAKAEHASGDSSERRGPPHLPAESARGFLPRNVATDSLLCFTCRRSTRIAGFGIQAQCISGGGKFLVRPQPLLPSSPCISYSHPRLRSYTLIALR
jgi:hypothetical protein